MSSPHKKYLSPCPGVLVGITRLLLGTPSFQHANSMTDRDDIGAGPSGYGIQGSKPALFSGSMEALKVPGQPAAKQVQVCRYETRHESPACAIGRYCYFEVQRPEAWSQVLCISSVPGTPHTEPESGTRGNSYQELRLLISMHAVPGVSPTGSEI